MKAININTNESIDVFEADVYTKRIASDCKYWFEEKGNRFTFLLCETDKIRKGYEYCTYRINNQLYTRLLTNRHSELIEFYNQSREKKKIIQETLF